MSGTPTEAEIQTQWKNAVDALETFRNLVDGTLAGSGGKWDLLETSLEGEYTPADLAAWVNNFRGGCSELLTPGFVSQMLTPIWLEYGRILAASAGTGDGFGSGFRSAEDLHRAIYDWFIENTLTIKSRTITFDTTPLTGTTTITNVGNGSMTRLTVDENNFPLEACHVEKKIFRCQADQNSGTEENAEVFEMIGEAASFDSILRASHGSGESARTTIVSHNAGGSNAGGSLLLNSSFSDFSSTGSPKFTGWTESAVPTGSIDQDTTNYYRPHPGAQTNASLEITGGLGTVTLKQTLANMRVRRLDRNTPYFLRAMFNREVGTATGGTLTIRMGGASTDVALAAQTGWNEIMIAAGQNSWFKNFNEDPFDVEIEWSSSTSGTLLVDDVIFAPYDLIDGTYWFLRGNNATHVPWLVDDTLTFEDTGGAPATGKLQWYLFVAGLGYLPSSGTPSITDP